MTDEKYEQAQEIKRKEQSAKEQKEFWNRIDNLLYMDKLDGITGYWVKSNTNERLWLTVGEIRALYAYDKEQEEKYAKEFSEL